MLWVKGEVACTNTKVSVSDKFAASIYSNITDSVEEESCAFSFFLSYIFTFEKLKVFTTSFVLTQSVATTISSTFACCRVDKFQ